MTHAVAARYTTLVATLQDRREAGQNALEYLGMALVAGVIVAAIAGVLKGTAITKYMDNAWEDIIKGDG
ncbi:MAG: hypothetical protein ACRCXL_06215 [Dermatophilaceae bacterium]